MLSIAGIPLGSPLILAPLAGYSDLPFRLLCREFGAGLCYSEMISCHGLVYGQQKTLKMLASSTAERPVGFQLFGADVGMMAKAADLLNRFAPDIIDINMGCPVRKVTKKGAGAALMAAPQTAEAIIREVVKNSTAPVTVKFRKGVNQQQVNCVDFARMAESCGASAVTVHGRTWSQGFTGQADWQSIQQVKEAVGIPVIGNGDVCSHDEARHRLTTSGCDGVMIGRGALGNPWVFSSAGRPTELQSVCAGARRHLTLMEQHLEVDRILGCIKNHIGRYFRNLQGSARLRKTVHEAPTFKELQDRLREISLSRVGA